MELIIYVHDFHLEVGHSHAIIELCRHLPQLGRFQIEIVSYISSPPKDLTQNALSFRHRKVPFARLRPTLLKSLFYHLYSALYYCYKKARSPQSVHLSIGAASLFSDLVSVQFVHAQWNPLYFKTFSLSPLRWVYKQLAFQYFAWAEKAYFSHPQTKFMPVSHFVSDYCQQSFHVPSSHIQTIPSGVNIQRFRPVLEKREALLHRLTSRHPQLKTLNPRRTTILFVGTFERKGLPLLLKALRAFPELQLLVVGQSETPSQFPFPPNIHLCHIPFSRHIEDFYDLADAFIFPSLYDPFGLVILEAFAKGLPLLTFRHHVGASELIAGEDEVSFIEDIPLHQYLKSLSPLSLDRREELHNKRKAFLRHHSWEVRGKQFHQLLHSLIGHSP